MRLKERVAKLEAGLKPGQGLFVCHIEGGGILSATYAGLSFTPEPGEPRAAFETRMTRAATDAGASLLCIGSMIEDDLVSHETASDFDPSSIPDEERETFEPTAVPADENGE